MRKIILTGVWVVVAVVFMAACSHSPGDRTETVGSGNPLITFYRGPLDHLSAVRSGQCPMHPSCSEYSRQCLKRFGPVKGWIMALDRLMRCGRDELKLSPLILVNGRQKTYDPVDNNIPRTQ